MSLKALDKFLMKAVLRGENGAENTRKYYKTRLRSDIGQKIADIPGGMGPKGQELVDKMNAEHGEALFDFANDEVPMTEEKLSKINQLLYGRGR